MIETRRISASTITAEILMNSKVVDDKLGNNFSQKNIYQNTQHVSEITLIIIVFADHCRCFVLPPILNFLMCLTLYCHEHCI
jgi:hypothetical protein